MECGAIERDLLSSFWKLVGMRMDRSQSRRREIKAKRWNCLVQVMMENSKSRAIPPLISQNHNLVFLLLIYIQLFTSFLPCSAQKPVVGYGYKIQSISGHNSGKLLTADLQLVKKSPTYGPDIQSLTLTAR